MSSFSTSQQVYTLPVITELLGITSAVMPLFRGLGYRYVKLQYKSAGLYSTCDN